MSYYRLASSGRPDIVVNEIVLSRDEFGEVDSSVNASTGTELSEEQYNKAIEAAGRIGYRLVEVDAPSDSESGQPVGADAASGSPSVTQTGEASSEIDQQTAQNRGGQASQQGTGGRADQTGASSGTPGITTP